MSHGAGSRNPAMLGSPLQLIWTTLALWSVVVFNVSPDFM